MEGEGVFRAEFACYRDFAEFYRNSRFALDILVPSRPERVRHYPLAGAGVPSAALRTDSARLGASGEWAVLILDHFSRAIWLAEGFRRGAWRRRAKAG